MPEPLRMQLAVPPEHLRRRVDPDHLPATTADVPPLEGTIGQPRALDALALAWRFARLATTSSSLALPGRAASARSTSICGSSRRLGPHLDELREAYSDQPRVLTYLDQVRRDLPEHLDDFRSGEAEGEQQLSPTRLPGPSRDERLARYRGNVFVDNDDSQGAPVVVEHNPTYYNLTGRIDYRATFGALVTDFRQIKPGSLQRANGGFLVLQVLDVLRTPLAWEALKRSLICGAVTIENLGEQVSALPTEQLRPEPILLDVKVILLGPTEVYALLYQADPDFHELFKIKADFAPDMDWNEEHLGHYTVFIGILLAIKNALFLQNSSSRTLKGRSPERPAAQWVFRTTKRV